MAAVGLSCQRAWLGQVFKLLLGLVEIFSASLPGLYALNAVLITDAIRLINYLYPGF